MAQPYREIFKRYDLFDNALYGLSTVRHRSIAGSDTSDYRIAPTDQRKHVSMLNWIALMLIYKDKGGAVATGFMQQGLSYRVFWSKNDNIAPTKDESDYMENLQAAFRNSDVNGAFEKIMVMCRRKVLSRIKKLQVHIQDKASTGSTNVFSLDDSDPQTVEFRRYLVDNGIIQDAPLQRIIKSFTDYLSLISSSASVEELENIVELSYWLTGPVMNISSVSGFDEFDFHKIKKVGDYKMVCVEMVSLLDGLPPNVRSNFTLEQVFPPAQKRVQVFGDTVKALNTFPEHYPVSPIREFAELRGPFPEAKPGPDREIELWASQHCELTVALFIWQRLQQSSRGGTIEIGCSKASCYYCGKYIDFFNAWAKNHIHPSHILASDRHGKYVNGWCLPISPNIAELNNQMLDHVGDLLYEVFNATTGLRRKSDSHSLSEGHPDVNTATKAKLAKRPGQKKNLSYVVKFLLIIAPGIANVAAISLEQFVDVSRRRPGKRVKLGYPNLLASPFSGYAIAFDLRRPTTCGWMIYTLARAAKSAGALTSSRVTSNNLWRGAAWKAAHGNQQGENFWRLHCAIAPAHTIKKAKDETTRKASKLNDLDAGDPNKLSSFVDCHRNEPMCAMYLGFSDIGAFRKFELALPALEFANQWAKFKCGSRSHDTILELIRDLRDDPDDRFPKDAVQMMSTYGPNAPLRRTEESNQSHQKEERDRNANYLAATIIYRLAACLSPTKSGPLEPSEDQHARAVADFDSEPMELTEDSSPERSKEQHARAVADFEVLNPDLKVPYIDLETVQAPQLGPFTNLGEDELEKYNRVYNLLRSIDLLSAPSRWLERMVKQPPFRARRIHPTNMPRWMVGTSTRLHSSRPVTPPHPPMNILVIHTVHRKTKYSAALITHAEEFLSLEGLDMPPLEITPKRDPRDYESGPHWRDTLRRQLSLQALRVDFFTMALVIPHTSSEDDGKQITFYGPSSSPSQWQEVKKILSQNVLEIQFTYTLRPLEEGEEFDYEYSGPPIALEQDLRLDASGDIEQFPLPSPPPQDDDDNELDPQAAAENKVFMAGGGIAGKKPPIPQSEFSNADRQRMLDQHDGIDVMTDEGLEEWKNMAVNTILANHRALPRPKKEALFQGNRRVTKAQRDAIRESQAAGEIQALATDAPEMMTDGRYYQVHGAFSGAQSQVGPFVDASKTVLGMTVSGKHHTGETLDQNRCIPLPKCKAQFLDSQVTGATFILQRMYGTIPVGKDRSKLQDVARAVMQLESIRTCGGFLADITGLGKTDESLLALSWSAVYGDHTDGHRPHLAVVPNGTVFNQWQEKIWNDYRDLTLIVSNDNKPSDHRFAENWVSSTAMREAPDTLRNWPSHLKYIFDKTDPRSSKVVILTPYDSHATRTIALDWVDKKDPKRTEALALPDHNSDSRERIKRERTKRPEVLQSQEPIFRSKWKGIFECIWLDEGHKIRHAITRINASILLLDAPFLWVLTATPVINSSYDILGPLHVMWQQVQKRLMGDQTKLDWLKEQPESTYHIFSRLDELPSNDVRRLIALDPNRIRALLDTRDVAEIAKFYHYLDDLVSIRRSTASVLHRAEGGEPIPLSTMMPKHQVKTVELEYDEDEGHEMQWFHRNNARLYTQAMSGSGDGEDFKVSKTQGLGPNHTKRRQNKFPPITAHARRLAIIAKSTKLARFDYVMQKLGQKTLVEQMEGYRSVGHSAEWVVDMVLKPGDPHLTTRLQKLQFLSEGSPTLRFILSQIQEMGLLDSDMKHAKAKFPPKLLITEDVPLTAWYWEICLRYLYINTETLHSGLTFAERVALVKRFNDKKDPLKVLVLMYSAWGRIIRVSQLFEVLVIRIRVLNSNDEFRESKQTDKAIMDMSTRAADPEVQKLLIALLNENNWEVKEAHESAEGIALKSQIKEQSQTNPLTVEIEDGQKLASTVADAMDLGTDDSPRSPKAESSQAHRRSGRAPKPVSRLIDDPENQKTILEGDDYPGTDSDESRESEHSEYSEQATDYDEDYQDLDFDFGSDESDSSEKKGEKVKPEQDDYIVDPDGDTRLVSRTTKELRQRYSQFTKTEQEEFDQDSIALRQLLSLKVDRVYELSDLNDPEILDRSLRLLYRARFGQSHERIRISPHIRYDKLTKQVCRAIEKNSKMDHQEITRKRAIAASVGGFRTQRQVHTAERSGEAWLTCSTPSKLTRKTPEAKDVVKDGGKETVAAAAPKGSTSKGQTQSQRRRSRKEVGGSQGQDSGGKESGAAAATKETTSKGQTRSEGKRSGKEEGASHSQGVGAKKAKKAPVSYIFTRPLTHLDYLNLQRISHNFVYSVMASDKFGPLAKVGLDVKRKA
ncbi:MAG: hypothetical protein Q9170_003622 [Blastenia crenularia]